MGLRGCKRRSPLARNRSRPRLRCCARPGGPAAGRGRDGGGVQCRAVRAAVGSRALCPTCSGTDQASRRIALDDVCDAHHRPRRPACIRYPDRRRPSRPFRFRALRRSTGRSPALVATASGMARSRQRGGDSLSLARRRCVGARRGSEPTRGDQGAVETSREGFVFQWSKAPGRRDRAGPGAILR